MSNIATQDRIITHRIATATQAAPVIEHEQAPSGFVERRRPGRSNDVSPELVALMRKPTTEARLRVMLYDAPNFVLPQATGHRRSPYHAVRMTVAVASCSLVWAAAFRSMMLLWG